MELFALGESGYVLYLIQPFLVVGSTVLKKTKKSAGGGAIELVGPTITGGRRVQKSLAD